MKIGKRKKQLTDDEKHYCLRCGKEISEEEYVKYAGFCEECYWLEEDELDEELFF